MSLRYRAANEMKCVLDVCIENVKHLEKFKIKDNLVINGSHEEERQIRIMLEEGAIMIRKLKFPKIHRGNENKKIAIHQPQSIETPKLRLDGLNRTQS